jgi:hypothetical protein
MNRSGMLFALVVSALIASGCDSGIQEGVPPGPLQSGRTPEFEKYMEKAAGKMAMQKKAGFKGGPVAKGDAKATPAPAAATKTDAAPKSE